jgi:NADH:ubiquinone oxidoreductase subunit 6 (subunit J)
MHVIWIDLLLVVIFALFLSNVLIWGIGWRHPAERDTVGVSLLFLFVILALAMWAGGVWLPGRPVLYGTSWLGLLLIGVLVSLLIMSLAAPVRRARAPDKTATDAQEEIVAATAFGIFFWTLIAALLIVALIGYLI